MAEAPDWGMKRQALSPRYTTERDELLVVQNVCGITLILNEALDLFQAMSQPPSLT